MLIARILHVIGNIVWLGGGLAAAFAMALLAAEGKDTRLAAARALRKLVVTAVTPGMLLSLGAGLYMLLDGWSAQYARAPWMHAKLTVGLIAAAFSGVLSGRLRRAAAGDDQIASGPLRTAGVVLLLSAIANVTFVFLRFGAR
jgi:putative membrane protein